MFEGVADVRWMDAGNCLRLEDPSVMFPQGTVAPEALRACASCPVLARCRAYGDQLEATSSRDSIVGFLAGETAVQRIARRKLEATALLADAVPV